MPRRALLGVLIAFALLPVAAASANGGMVLPATAHPYGHTYGEWAATWWQWALDQPAPTNAVLDSTGAFCGQGQAGQVWFLAGTFGGPAVTRSCTVPAGKALLLPVLNDAYFAFPTDPPSQRTEAYVRSQVTAVATATALFATIDGVNVPNIPDYLEQSSLFSVTLPADNLFGLDAGFVLDPCADEGYYLVLSPLTPGRHTIRFGGTYGGADNPTSVDVTYDLTVQPS